MLETQIKKLSDKIDELIAALGAADTAISASSTATTTSAPKEEKPPAAKEEKTEVELEAEEKTEPKITIEELTSLVTTLSKIDMAVAKGIVKDLCGQPSLKMLGPEHYDECYKRSKEALDKLANDSDDNVDDLFSS